MLGRYQALGGGSPNFSAVPFGNEDYLVLGYNDTLDAAYARTSSAFATSGPQSYYSGWTKINKATNGGVTSWDALACHEVGHLLGLYHVTEGLIKGSRATCMGGSFDGPYIDDQMNLPAIYAAPAGS